MPSCEVLLDDACGGYQMVSLGSRLPIPYKTISTIHTNLRVGH